MENPVPFRLTLPVRVVDEFEELLIVIFLSKVFPTLTEPKLIDAVLTEIFIKVGVPLPARATVVGLL